jgi:tetratricopeptide (TPR) repeat protein
VKKSRIEVQKLLSELLNNYSKEAAEVLVSFAKDNYYLDYLYFTQGFIEQKNGHREEAMEYYRKCIIVRPDFTGAHNQIGNCYYELGNYDEALKWYDKSIELIEGVERYIPYYNKGNTFRIMRRYEEAINCYLISVDYNKLCKDNYLRLLDVFIDIVNFEKFIELSDEVSKLFPDSKELSKDLSIRWNNLGVELHNKDRAKARECYNNALRFDPNYNLPYNNLALICAGEGNYPDAILNYGKAISADPSYANAYYNLAALYAIKNDLDNAVTNLKKAIDLDPKYKEKAKSLADFNKIKDSGKFKELVFS